jgi:anti-sigma factor RsiW
MRERHVGGLWCHDVVEHLDAFVDGTLDAETLRSVEVHVAECSECAAFGAAYGRLVEALRSGPAAALDEARLQRLRRGVGGAS